MIIRKFYRKENSVSKKLPFHYILNELYIDYYIEMVLFVDENKGALKEI